MSLIGEKSSDTYGDRNLVIDEALRVTYSKTKISGAWGYVSANVSGSYSYMREFHRYATKSFSYVGMTYDVAKKCRDDMIERFTREFKQSIWNGDTMGGGWTDETAGETLMADITLVHGEGDEWRVHVRVNEDDVRYRLISASEFTSYKTIFISERRRLYGSDGEGTADETEETEATA